jgi:hypothetical protein
MTIKKIPLDAVSTELLRSTAPTITNVSLNAGLIGTSSISLTGTNFAAGMTVVVDQTIITNVTINNANSATVIVPAKSAGTYPFYVYNSNGTAVAYGPGIRYSGAPVWTTPAGSLGSAYELVDVDPTVTDVLATSNSAVTYAFYSGTLPPGTTLNTTTGAISGASTSVGTAITYNFTLSATNADLGVATRVFTITINPDVVTWSSPAADAIFSGTVGVPFTRLLTATSAAGLSITYTADVLPAGLTLSGNLISGTPNANSSISTYITATSTAGKISTRRFIWSVFSVPNAPTIGTATRSASQTIQVTYTAPGYNGGTAITSYTAVSNPGGLTGTVSQAGSGTITVGGLTNGTAYTFTVYATNIAGNSASSSDSGVVTPYGVPAAPTIGTATRSASQTVQVTYTAPLDNGGSTVTGYTATSSPNNITGTVSQAGSGTITVGSLTNGTAYTFTVTATNVAGTGAASQPSNTATPYTVPGQPTIGTATATGQTTATVAYTAPASNGGSAITSYTATSSPGGITGTLSQAGSGTITVTGLTAGTPYTFTVYATNAAGVSILSTASNQITTQAATISVEYLVVAGGGGGGAGIGGGGGAGGYLTSTLSVTLGTQYTVTVGGGGLGGTIYQQTRFAAPGNSSVFASVTANGGGGGANDGTTGQSGGSGGGGGDNRSGGSGNQGNAGGSGGNNLSGGGGGGAGSVGGNAPNGSTGGAGGAGTTNAITGTSTWYAGGGGGCGNSTGGAGTLSNGGGGAGGGGDPSSGGGATANTGGGGGASRGSLGVPGNGGSGVVIIAYSNASPALSSISGGLSYDQPSRSGYRVYRFTGGTGPISW